MSGSQDGRLRRLALQIVAQLPDNSAEAALVLKYAERLVAGFLSGNDHDEANKKVVPLRPPA